MKLVIPETLKVGFQERADTWSGKLAYITYIDGNGKHRKETSWKNWKDDSIETLTIPNDATEGFVLNKSGGGSREAHHYNPRNEFIRVYDPRGFEFEISLPNLLFILKECDCNRGKGLEGKFVYGWDGTSLVLIPTHSQDYKDSLSYTSRVHKKLKIRDLSEGCTCVDRDGSQYVYLGRFNFYFLYNENGYWPREKDRSCVAKRHVWWDIDNKVYRIKEQASWLCEVISTDAPSDYADVVDDYHGSGCGSPIDRLYLKPRDVRNGDGGERYVWVKEDDGFIQYSIRFHKGVQAYGLGARGPWVYACRADKQTTPCVRINKIKTVTKEAPRKYTLLSSYWGVDVYSGPVDNIPLELKKVVEAKQNELIAVLESGVECEFQQLYVGGENR